MFHRRNPTWQELRTFYACYPETKDGRNPYYEPFTIRKFNPTRSDDATSVRIVFLDRLLRDHRERDYRALVRDGRPVRCYDLRYEGTGLDRHRQFSFTLRGGKKRFVVSEHYALLVSSRTYVRPVWPNRAKPNDGILHRMGTVFGFPPAIQMMYYNSPLAEYLTYKEFSNHLEMEHPLSPGSLVAPRLGLWRNLSSISDKRQSMEFPYGLILGKEKRKYSELYGRELFIVRICDQVVRNVHLAEMELIKEHEDL